MLIVGKDKSEIIEHLPDSFLFIDDGALIDTLPTQKRRGTELDFSRNLTADFDNWLSYNPLKDMDYRRAREFISVLDAVFPEGESTLTKKASNFELLKALSDRPQRLSHLITPDKDRPGTIDAHQKMETLLLSPVLKRFLTRPTNIPLQGILLARLDRSVLTDFDAFVIANLLISAYQGHVVIPDFGFYACPFHASLIRQDRLIAGVNFLDEARELKDMLLLMDTKLARRSTADDAHALAVYANLIPGTNAFNDFIAKAVGSA